MIAIGAAFLEQAIDNLAHALRDDGDGDVGFLAPAAKELPIPPFFCIGRVQ